MRPSEGLALQRDRMREIALSHRISGAPVVGPVLRESVPPWVVLKHSAVPIVCGIFLR